MSLSKVSLGRKNLFAAALAAGAMAAGFMPAAATPSKEQAPAIVTEKKKRRSQRQVKKGTTRRARIKELEARERFGTLTNEAMAELRGLRRLQQLARGRLARRMRRRRKPLHFLGGTRPVHEPPPFRAGQRVPRAIRVAILREEKRPITGRQWKRFKKWARRQERAA